MKNNLFIWLFSSTRPFFSKSLEAGTFEHHIFRKTLANPGFAEIPVSPDFSVVSGHQREAQKLTVVASQYRRPSGSLLPSAEPVEQRFYINENSNGQLEY